MVISVMAVGQSTVQEWLWDEDEQARKVVEKVKKRSEQQEIEERWELFGEHLQDIYDDGCYDYFDHIEEPDPHVDDERIGAVKSEVGR